MGICRNPSDPDAPRTELALCFTEMGPVEAWRQQEGPGSERRGKFPAAGRLPAGRAALVRDWSGRHPGGLAWRRLPRGMEPSQGHQLRRALGCGAGVLRGGPSRAPAPGPRARAVSQPGRLAGGAAGPRASSRLPPAAPAGRAPAGRAPRLQRAAGGAERGHGRRGGGSRWRGGRAAGAGAGRAGPGGRGARAPPLTLSPVPPPADPPPPPPRSSGPGLGAAAARCPSTPSGRAACVTGSPPSPS